MRISEFTRITVVAIAGLAVMAGVGPRAYGSAAGLQSAAGSSESVAREMSSRAPKTGGEIARSLPSAGGVADESWDGPYTFDVNGRFGEAVDAVGVGDVTAGVNPRGAPPVVPAPGAVLLGIIGLGLVVAARKGLTSGR
ncbi:MAG: hypothetical protein KJ749_01415 [Planctomycetes bacterium]|nr:hypothetical protein [Planctomycetota bacterium]